MKKKLLYLTSIVLFSITTINAQTKTWDFGTDIANWPVDPTGYSVDTKKQNLGIYPAAVGQTNIGIIDGNQYTFTDSYVSTNRFKMGGSTTLTGNLPTARYLYFTVAGSGNVKIWFRSGSNSAARSITVSDGTNVLGTATSTIVSSSAVGVILDVPFTNVNGKIYIYNDAACYIYKIEVTGPGASTLGTNTFSKESDVAVYTKDNKVLFSNIKSKTNIAVYSLTGALVKSADVTEDAALEVENGVYVVKVQSAEGEKTVKVIVQ